MLTELRTSSTNVVPNHLHIGNASNQMRSQARYVNCSIMGELESVRLRLASLFRRPPSEIGKRGSQLNHMKSSTIYGERGATLPEYALLSTILLFCCLTVLTQSGEAANQNFCLLAETFGGGCGTQSTEPGGNVTHPSLPTEN